MPCALRHGGFPQKEDVRYWLFTDVVFRPDWGARFGLIGPVREDGMFSGVDPELTDAELEAMIG